MADAPNIILLANILLTMTVVIVAYFDWRTRRIPNLIIFPLAMLGIILHGLRGLDGVWFGVQGLLAGFSLLFIPYLFRAMGAGDVKYLAAIGAWLGAYGSLRVLLITLMVYPVVALLFVMQQGKLKITLRRFGRLTSKLFGAFIPAFKLYAEQLALTDDPSIASATTPFGLTLSIGTLLALYTNFLR